MKIVRITYTTKADYSEKNQLNIKQVMSDLQKANHPGINYTACLAADSKTFAHTAFFNSEEDQQFLNELASFKNFQEQLKSGGLESPPKQEILTLVGNSNPIF